RHTSSSCCPYSLFHASYLRSLLLALFFFNDTAPPDIYPLSLHDALPISTRTPTPAVPVLGNGQIGGGPGPNVGILALGAMAVVTDRKSTRLNSSHVKISYAVFCLKKKKKKKKTNEANANRQHSKRDDQVR